MDSTDLHEIEYAITENGFKCSGKSDVVTNRLDKLEAMCTDLFRQLRGIREAERQQDQLNANHTDAIVRNSARIAKMDEENALNVTATDARMDRLSCILNEHEQRLAKMAEEQAADVQQAHNRMDNICSHISRVDDSARKALSLKPFIQALDERLDATDTWRKQTEARLESVEKARAWIDTFEVKKFADVINVRLDQQGEAIDQISENAERRVKALENYTGLDVRSAPTATNRTTCGHPECGQCYPEPRKPTIKGGWVNVWERNGRITWDEMPWTTKEGADTQTPCGRRIACIRIPDFTEGEGL